MPEISQQRSGELLRNLFEVLIQNPEGLQAKDALSLLEQRIKLTDYEKGTYSDGIVRFGKIVRFATISCVKAGWLTKHKGRWILTDEGRVAYKSFPDPEKFYIESVRLYHEWAKKRPDIDVTSPAAKDIPSDNIPAITYEEAEEQAWAEIEKYIGAIQPYEFQDMIAALLKAMGYHVVWIAPPGKDGGVDIVACPDPLGTKAPRMKVQVKREMQSISTDIVRSFLSLLGDDDIGLFVSRGGFTRDAQIAVAIEKKHKITLLDLEGFVELWTQNYYKLDDDARRKFPLQPIYFLAPKS